MRAGRRWTPEDDASLRRMAEANYTPEQMAVLGRRTVAAIYCRCAKLGIHLRRRPIPNDRRRTRRIGTVVKIGRGRRETGKSCVVG